MKLSNFASKSVKIACLLAAAAILIKSRKGELRCLTHPSSNVQFFKFVADVHRTIRSFAAALICTGQKMARNASQKMVRNSPEPSSSRAAQARNAPEPSLLAGASTAQILVDRHE